jgi:hypothetical protein
MFSLKEVNMTRQISRGAIFGEKTPEAVFIAINNVRGWAKSEGTNREAPG